MQNSIIKEFMNKTKLSNMGMSGRKDGIPRPDFEQNPEGEFDKIALPIADSSSFPSMDVVEAIEKRKSIRDYASITMSINELSLLLWCTQGVKRIVPNAVAFRNVPSAGARNAFETFLLINNVDGLESGLYKYVALEHALLKLDLNKNLAEKFTLACDEQKQVKNSNVTFIWTAVPDRMTWSYAERSYRYLFLDAGHVCQNLYLVAEKLNLGVCAIGHYDDDTMNSMLNIDGETQFTIYIATVGKAE